MTDDLSRLASALADRYRILRPLGAGGMATVYLAEDLKHDRKVAVKVLKPELAAVLGAERFVVEIKTTAALQHPHILPLFDSGEADGFLFYVMPFIDGETLRDKLNRETQLGVEEAVRLTSDVAEALAYAHSRGVVHRDIKPENILLANGRPMVADFGIALAVSAAAGGRMTETGLSLGTPHYMSPEQATAEKEITGRSDVYSLASVLYEMLTGEPPHMGNSAQQVIMKIITDRARPVTELRPTVPMNVAAALAKALEKLPADRFASASEFSAALANSTFALAAVPAHGRGPSARDWRTRAAIPAVVAAVLLAAVSIWSLARPVPQPAVASYRVQLAADQQLASGMWPPLAVSPDGSLLAYVGHDGAIFVRARHSLDATALAGTAGAFNPFFSPDGTQIGFMIGVAGGAEIRVMSATGGPATLVTRESVGGPGAAWGYDGYIYYDNSGVGPLRRVPATGGASEFISALDDATGELQHVWPEPLPNGRAVLFTIDRAGPGAAFGPGNDVAVLDLRTGKHKVLTQGMVGRYMAPGYLLFVTAGGTLMAAPFDQDRMELTGTPISVREGVGVSSAGNAGVHLAVGKSGTLWYMAGGITAQRELARVDMRGAYTPLDTSWRGGFVNMALSPDGTRVAVAMTSARGAHLWVRPTSPVSAPATQLTLDGTSTMPAWHPDGRQLVLVSRDGGRSEAWTMPADGSVPPKKLWSDGSRIENPRWSPDGKWLLYERRPESRGRDVYGIRIGQDSAPRPLLTAPYSEYDAMVSPDGRWLLYVALAGDLPQAYIRPFPETDRALVQVSAPMGVTARWAPDGRAVYYRDAVSVVRVEVRGDGPTLELGQRRVLFPMSMGGVRDWEPLPDGSGFLVVREQRIDRQSDLIVVENFATELAQRFARAGR